MAKMYLEPYEIEKLIETVPTLRDKLLIQLLFHLGCRISEVINLSIDDFNIESRLVTIQHLKTRVRISCLNCGTSLGRSSLFCSKCGVKVKDAVIKQLEHRRRRTIPIDNQTIAMLKEYIKYSKSEVHDGKNLIFSFNRHRAWQIVKGYAEIAGLPKLTNPETGRIHYVSPHRFRDAFAINAMKTNDSGDGLRLLQVYLGHASFNTTVKYRKYPTQNSAIGTKVSGVKISHKASN
jgi:integrase/recombinase XerD